MKPILLRAPKSPFEVVDPLEVQKRNLIGDNAGNLVFIHAAWKLLSTRDATIEAAGMGGAPQRADEVNERFGMYVAPLANAFRLDWIQQLERMVSFIERLKIPVAILGVGAQGRLDFDPDELKPIEPLVRRFVNAVLEHGPSIGVRGEITAGYLERLGYRDVEVIGCPSMFLDGPRIGVEKRAEALDRRGRRMAINISPYVAELGSFVMRHARRYPKLTYIAQDKVSLAQILLGEPEETADIPDPMPNHLSHPLFRSGRVRFYVEPWPWIADLRAFDFSFGSRIHGNIAAIVAGTPAYVLAHDARTLELARYFEIPHRTINGLPDGIDATDLYAEADYSALVAGHSQRFDRFSAYLERHGLRHVFADGEDPGAFDRRIAEISYPPPLTTPSRSERFRAATRERTDATVAFVRRVPRGIRRRATKVIGRTGG